MWMLLWRKQQQQNMSSLVRSELKLTSGPSTRLLCILELVLLFDLEVYIVAQMYNMRKNVFILIQWFLAGALILGVRGTVCSTAHLHIRGKKAHLGCDGDWFKKMLTALLSLKLRRDPGHHTDKLLLVRMIANHDSKWCFPCIFLVWFRVYVASWHLQNTDNTHPITIRRNQIKRGRKVNSSDMTKSVSSWADAFLL